ncbi:extracellular solute-binding protein [Bradyrhizobium sp. B117]|uniref:extracellular solute-binding protein n=1 Tax=Bradyrhizobium sp. B117 TaxID=3140246 RepID=UPI00318319FF
MWRYLKIIVVISLANALVGGIMSPAKAEDGRTLRVTAASSDLNAMWVELARTFENEHPGVKVELDNSTRGYDDLVQATLRASLTGSLPDVSFQGANRLRIYTDRNLAVPLGQFLNTDTSDSRKALSPAVEKIGASKGDSYALGFGVAEPVVFYNLDLLARVGGDPSHLPTTWDEIIRLGSSITKLGEGNVGLIFQYNSEDFFWDALLFSQNAAMMNSDESRIAFDGPEGLKALEIIKRIGESGQASVDMSKDQARSLFAAGKVGIIFDSNSNQLRFEEDSKDKFRLAVGRFPLMAPNGTLPAAGSIAMMFATKPEQQKLAWEFMKFASGPTGQKIVALKSGWLPANEFATRDSTELSGHFAKNTNYKASLDQLPILRGWYAFPGENAPKVTKVIVDAMRSVITLQKPPEAGLQAMATQARKLLGVK